MTISPFSLMTVGMLMVFAGLQSVAQAQLFGSRIAGTSPGSQLRSPFGNNGQGVVRGTGPSLGSANQLGAPGGVLDGNERFVRGNRSRQDFVGTGRNDLSGFVGSEQAIGVGRVPAATDNFRLKAINAARINKPLPAQPAKGMYYPRLVLDLGSSSSEPISRPTPVAASSEIQRRVKNAGGENVLVFVAGDTAIVKGTVDSQRNAELLIHILSFEPGIDRVDNQLTVR